MARKINIEIVVIAGKRSGRCAVCGKRALRARVFWQTVNSGNKNAAGLPKTAAEIRRELYNQVKAWEGIPAVHAKCEKKEKKEINK